MSLESELQDFTAHIGLAAGRHMPPAGVAGLIADGTYDPKYGTVKVYIGSEMLQYDDEGNLKDFTALPPYGPFPLLATHIGQQGAPTGGERCYLIPVEGGALVAIAHFDDSPGIPAGEHITQHPAHTSSHFHLKNDGSSVHSAETIAIVTAPQVLLGEKQSSGNDGVVREADLQKGLDDLKKAVQQALNQLAQTVQSGSGVAAPSVDSVTAQASQVSFSA